MICGSGKDKLRAYHVVSAFVTENHLTLGEICVEETTNEITAVPELLDLIDVKGDIVTADAMSCQKKIVEKIIDKKVDYTIGLKQNQPALYKDTEDYFKAFSADIPSKTTIEKGHGRIEKRKYQLLTDLSWLEQKNERAGGGGRCHPPSGGRRPGVGGLRPWRGADHAPVREKIKRGASLRLLPSLHLTCLRRHSR